MKRSLTFRPAVGDLLEARLVLSSVHPVVAEAAKSHSKATQAHVPLGTEVQGVTQQTFSTGLVQTTRRTIVASGNDQATAQDLITNSDGTSETDTATGSLSNGTTTVNVTKVFSTGVTQSEVDTQTSTTTCGTLQANGTVIPGSRKAGLVATTNFTHITTQPGLGTQVIVGTSVNGRVGKLVQTITNQQVTNFDGTVDQVHIVTKQTAKPAIADVSKTVTQANGSSVTTTSTIKILSGSLDGVAIA